MQRDRGFLVRYPTLVAAAALLAGCAGNAPMPTVPVQAPAPPAAPTPGPLYDAKLLAPPPPAPRCVETAAFAEEGEASWYGPRYQGRSTASGEPFDMDALTAAHRRLPFGTLIRVTNLENGRSVVVTVNDRGPHIRRRIVDLSQRAAADLDLIERGVAPVRIAALRCG